MASFAEAIGRDRAGRNAMFGQGDTPQVGGGVWRGPSPAQTPQGPGPTVSRDGQPQIGVDVRAPEMQDLLGRIRGRSGQASGSSRSPHEAMGEFRAAIEQLRRRMGN